MVIFSAVSLKNPGSLCIASFAPLLSGMENPWESVVAAFQTLQHPAPTFAHPQLQLREHHALYKHDQNARSNILIGKLTHPAEIPHTIMQFSMQKGFISIQMLFCIIIHSGEVIAVLG